MDAGQSKLGIKKFDALNSMRDNLARRQRLSELHEEVGNSLSRTAVVLNRSLYL